MNLIDSNISKIKELCEKFKVNKLYAFGSVLTSRFNDESDVDILVKFQNDVTYHLYADLFFGLHNALESLFGRKVDLVDEEALRNKYFIEELNRTRQIIYGH
ncbi:MAG: nucleotidyltransferase domain-containing protein [Muribaculaceae bacterium]|nr:nucleotidyltransferase domain-containing protein [Muribaculaceae bacterium]